MGAGVGVPPLTAPPLVGGGFVFSPSVVRVLDSPTMMVYASNDLGAVRYAVYDGPNLNQNSVGMAWSKTDQALTAPEAGAAETQLNSGPSGVNAHLPLPGAAGRPRRVAELQPDHRRVRGGDLHRGLGPDRRRHRRAGLQPGRGAGTSTWSGAPATATAGCATSGPPRHADPLRRTGEHRRRRAVRRPRGRPPGRPARAGRPGRARPARCASCASIPTPSRRPHRPPRRRPRRHRRRAPGESSPSAARCGPRCPGPRSTSACRRAACSPARPSA